MLEVEKSRRAVLISNPRAGRGGATRAREIARFRSYLDARGVEVEVWDTTAPGDATLFAARAASEGVREVVASGGDGTINETLQGLVGTDVRLAIWATGTANVLARELRLPFDAEGAAQVFARGRGARVSVGCATNDESGAQRYFFLMAGVGLDASVVRNVSLAFKRRVGQFAYWFAGFDHLRQWPLPTFTLDVGGEQIPSTFAIIGNAAGYGGGLKITPRARLDAPDFEVCVVNSQSRARYLYLLTRAMSGAGVSENLRGVRFLRATSLRATGDALVQTDGELIGALPMTFEVVPDSIEIVVP